MDGHAQSLIGDAAAVTRPASKVRAEAPANSRTRAGSTHTLVCRFHGTANATALAVPAYAMLRAHTTVRSRASIGRGWRSLASPTSRSTPFITYELSVLTRTRVNPGQRLHDFRPANLHAYLQAQRPHNVANCGLHAGAGYLDCEP